MAHELEQDLRTLHGEAFSWTLVCCGGDRETAEDVLQETYLRVLDGRLTFGGRSSFKTWLFAVVRRASRDRYRRRRLRDGLMGRWWSAADAEEPAAERRVADRQRRHRILQALGRLSDRQRQVLELVFFHDLSLREAAAVLEVSLGTASRHYDRGKRQLLSELEASGVEL